jgi:hypothetical protein
MNYLTTDWGPAIRHGCRSIAPVLVLIALNVTLAVERTYAAGFRLGCWVHAANDWLSAHWVALWVGPQPEPAPQLPRIPRQLPAAPAPIALLAPAPVPVDGLALALQLIAAGVSIRQAARKAGIPRSTLQRRLRYVIGIDPNGSGDDESVTMVFDITTNPWQVVARFHDARRSRD